MNKVYTYHTFGKDGNSIPFSKEQIINHLVQYGGISDLVVSVWLLSSDGVKCESSFMARTRKRRKKKENDRERLLSCVY